MKFLNYTNKTSIGRPSSLVIFGVLLGLASPAALGANVVRADENNDFLLAFRRPQNQSGTYLINVGPVSQLLAYAPGQTVPVSGVPNLAADLAAYTVFEGDTEVPWHSSSGVLWGGIGRNLADNNTGYVTKRRSSLETQSSPWAPFSNSVHGIVFNTRVPTVIQQGFNALEATANNPRGGYQEQAPAGSNEALYYYWVHGKGGLDFGYWDSIEGNFGAGAANSALDLYEHRRATDGNPSFVTYIGYFSISVEGVLSFTRASTPPGDVDSDGDGFTDAEEELAGTDPNDPSSFFTLPPPVRTAEGETSVQLATVANRRYIVEYSENLQSWAQVHVHLSGTGADPLDFLDDDPERSGNPRGFYRVIVGLPD